MLKQLFLWNIITIFLTPFIGETELSIKLMEQAKDESLAKVIYFFSAIYTTLQRIFNTDYNADLVYAHGILQAVYNTFVNSSQASQSPTSIGLISSDHIECLIRLSKELVSKTKEGKSWDDTLKGFVVLSYSLTGNGHYLMNYKKVLKLP